MVWIFRNDNGNRMNIEIKDFKSLTFASLQDNSTQVQHNFISGSIKDSELCTLQLVIPLPCNDIGNASIKVNLDGKYTQHVLETCRAIFPEVARQTDLYPPTDDSDDDESSDEEDSPRDAMQETKSKAMEYRKLKFKEQTEGISLENITLLNIGTHIAIPEFMGIQQPVCISLLLNLYTEKIVHFALSYTFQMARQNNLYIPISTEHDPAHLHKHHLEPVTRHMDHRIFTLGAFRNSEKLNCAGKSSLEMVDDMKHRHASGTCTITLPTLCTTEELLGILGVDATADIRNTLRCRRMVGPYNTSQDILMDLQDHFIVKSST